MSDTSLVLSQLAGPRKAEAVRRLAALAELTGHGARIGWIIDRIASDHTGRAVGDRAEVLAAIRIVLGEDGGSALGGAQPQMPMG